MAKQNQIIAIEKGAKSKAERELTDVHQRLGKAQLLTGLSRVYTAKDAEGDSLPSETHLVQVRTKEEIGRAEEALTEYWNVTAAKEWTNCEASADVKLDEKVLLEKVPVGYLLFLEKQLVNIATFIKKLPVLDPAESWHFDSAQNCYTTKHVEQVRTKKILRNHTKFAGDENHPPQVDVYTEDVQVGTWRVVKSSGALERKDVATMTTRVEALQRAVKMAREQANLVEAKRPKCADKVFAYLFG
jgi:hypothetical protein